MAARARLPPNIVADVLAASRRRCCICFALDGDDGVKKGQVAHLDQNAANSSLDNLAFLCFDHHDEYDSTTSQSKGFTVEEVRRYRAALYSAKGLSGTDSSRTVPVAAAVHI